MWMPGVGMWPPSRYTASMASANSSRLRRSGTRNMFVNASNSLFMTPFDFPPLIGLGAKHLRRSAGRLDLLQSRLGKVVGFHRDLARQYAGAEDLQAVADLVDHARPQQFVSATNQQEPHRSSSLL